MLLNTVNINDDYDQSVSIHENNINWDISEEFQYKEKLLSLDGTRKTSILELNKDSKLSEVSHIEDVEILVLEGTYSNEFGNFEKGTYLNLPCEDQLKVFCKKSCKIFKRANYLLSKERVIIDTNKEPWLEGHGNLTVIPLYDNTALVKWPKDEIFINHKHWGGEEVFVLEGNFMDEYGEFEKGTWIRNHHLSSHHPFVKKETIIFVKTGHLPE